MISEKISEIVNDEVEKTIHDKLKELEDVKIRRDQLQEKVAILQGENCKLKSDLSLFKSSGEFITKFTPLITEKNFESFVNSLHIEGTEIRISGMDSEKIPVWFRVMVKYYNHKPLILDLMELFDIKFPEWARSFRLPYDYTEEELDLFFKRISNAGMTNACYFEDNMGFYYRNLKSYDGDVSQMLKESSSFQIPWNLLLQNKLLTTERYFDKIIEKLEGSAYTSESKFFRMQEYQELSDRQISRMLDKLPEGELFDHHIRFVKNNTMAFKIKPKLVNRFLDKISDNQFSAFYYLNYPVEIQKDFIKRYRASYYDKFDLVKKMSISKEDKIELLGEIAEMELGADFE